MSQWHGHLRTHLDSKMLHSAWEGEPLKNTPTCVYTHPAAQTRAGAQAVDFGPDFGPWDRMVKGEN